MEMPARILPVTGPIALAGTGDRAAIGYGAPDLREGRRLWLEFLIVDGRALGLCSTPG